MKVLLLANHMNPGGIASYCVLLAKALKGLGVHAAVASGGGSLEELLREERIEHFKVPMDTSSEMNPMLLWAFKQLKTIIRREGFDMLHEQTRVTQVLSQFLSKELKMRYVSTCHGFLMKRALRSRFPFWGERVIAASPEVREHLLSTWGLEPGRVALVPHGLEASLTPQVQAGYRVQVRSQLNLSERETLIGFMGRLSDVKGADILIRSLTFLKNVPSYKVLLVGDGPEARGLKRLVKDLGLGQCVIFKGPLLKPHIWVSAFDIFCAPSRQEGFGLSILEAMSCRRAVVASRVGAIPGIISDGVTGLLFRSGSPEDLALKITSLMHDEAQRRRLGENAYETVLREYPIKKMGLLTQDVYEKVLETGTLRAAKT